VNIAIIVAAGSGQRFGSTRPKQFTELLGKPLLIHTLEKFELCPEIDEIVLVLSDDGRSEFEQIEARISISKLRQIVTGGKTRAESVRNGLDAIDAVTADIVAVHDGARPLVSVDEITRTVGAAVEFGAACLVAEVTDTIKEIVDQHIGRTIDRTILGRALTPQAFRYELLVQAFDGADLSKAITDECSLVEKMSHPIAVVQGSQRNIKITLFEDVILAEAVMRQAENNQE
jgi:2-C-methyl-D-erythritol 4-phosphate cytidylyltransferase